MILQFVGPNSLFENIVKYSRNHIIVYLNVFFPVALIFFDVLKQLYFFYKFWNEEI